MTALPCLFLAENLAYADAEMLWEENTVFFLWKYCWSSAAEQDEYCSTLVKW
jgi:hypothetical protein